eukprot:TRINITY_DN101546_c0_g1_i1.p1 TRINITY_DN101546_c0_g1~~TRINITY_DN101546_c0_g1_i1.p1  ORF type:complete len:771 (-),score=198.80 TRINITY_DN101546_c0_g1_i1:158-2470(-)
MGQAFASSGLLASAPSSVPWDSHVMVDSYRSSSVRSAERGSVDLPQSAASVQMRTAAGNHGLWSAGSVAVTSLGVVAASRKLRRKRPSAVAVVQVLQSRVTCGAATGYFNSGGSSSSSSAPAQGGYGADEEDVEEFDGDEGYEEYEDGDEVEYESDADAALDEAIEERKQRRQPKRPYQVSDEERMAWTEEDELDKDDVNPEEILFGDKTPFEELGVKDERLLKALKKLGFKCSTRVQGASIPMVLSEDRRAVVISAETGSGKTLCYLVPAFELILKSKPRKPGAPSPAVIVMVPGRELGFQVARVAEQIAKQITGRDISIYSARNGWPERAPDILVTTPRAAAQGLEPCASEDELARREAIDRVRDVELVVFDEADVLLGGGSHTADVQSVLTAIAAALPEQPREVLPEAQVYYKGGVPVEVYDEEGMVWKSGNAQWNPDGTFNVCYAPGVWEKFVRRSRLRGPGIGLHVEYGPRTVMAAATLPSYKASKLLDGKQNNKLLNSGIGSPDWVIKRWYPNAVRIESQWLHRRHPMITKQKWEYIPGEWKKDGCKNIPARIERLVELMKQEDASTRTLVFANSPDVCVAAEMALKAEKLKCVGFHSGYSFPERIEALKKFGKGQAPILICTDLAARGIDLPNCRHVVQLEFAKNPTEYLHRVGRGARAGRLSRTTNIYGDGDNSVRDMVLGAPAMGLDGQFLQRRGNRGRLRRIRRKQRKQEAAYADIRKRGREARMYAARKSRLRTVRPDEAIVQDKKAAAAAAAPVAYGE